MATYTKNEIMSSSEVVRNFGNVLNSVVRHRLEKVAIVRNNKLEAVILPIDEYEKMQEVCEAAERMELYSLLKEREKTSPDEYVDFADAMKRCGIDPDDLHD